MHGASNSNIHNRGHKYHEEWNYCEKGEHGNTFVVTLIVEDFPHIALPCEAHTYVINRLGRILILFFITSTDNIDDFVLRFLLIFKFSQLWKIEGFLSIFSNFC